MPGSSEEASREEIVRAVDVAMRNVADVVEILATSYDDEQATSRLSERFGISRAAAMSICDAQFRQLTVECSERRAEALRRDFG